MTLDELQVIITVNIAQILPQVREVQKAFQTLSQTTQESSAGMDKSVTQTAKNTQKALDDEGKTQQKSAETTKQAVKSKRQSLEEIAAIAQRAAERYAASINGMGDGGPLRAPTVRTGGPSSATAILKQQVEAAAQQEPEAPQTSGLQKLQAMALKARQSLASMFTGASGASEEAQAAMEQLISRLDNINARADLQRRKQAQLQAAYNRVAAASGSDSAQARKLQEQLLAVEARLQSLTRQSDKAVASLDGLSESMGETGSASEATGAESEEMGEGFQFASSRGGGFETTLRRIQMQIFRNLVVYGLLIKGLQGIGTYMWEALKTNTAFNDALNNLKVQLLTAFQPIYQAALPALTSLINALAKAITYVAAFLSGFFGKTYAQSEKGAAALNKNVKALQDTAKAASDAKKALAGFDEINTLSKNSASSGTSTGADASLLNTNFSSPSAKPLISESQIAAAEAAGRRVGAIVENIWKFVVKYRQPIIDAILAIIAAFLLFKTISAISSFIEAITSPIGLVVLAILAVVAAVLLVVHYWPEIKKAAQSAWNGVVAIWKDAGKWFGDRWNDIKNAFKDTKDWFKNKFTDARNGAQNAWNTVGGWFGNRWSDIRSAFSQTGWIATQFRNAYNDITRTWNGLPGHLQGIWDEVSSGFLEFINLMIYPLNQMVDGINSLQFNVPGWIPVIGGDHFGLSLQHIPYLAQGGIVSRATAFVAGEAGTEAVLPLENNTQWMDALAEKVAGKIGSGNLEVHSHLCLDGREIYQDVKKYAMRDAKGSNIPAFA